MKKTTLVRIFGSVLVAFSALSVAVATIAWFLRPGGETDKTINGEIGLRGYFYAGNGDEDTPFEIVTPNHFYNLCRLQNLGIFSNDRKYFQIGHDFGGSIGVSCIVGYENSNPIYDKYLDMGELSHTNKILPIGSESAPFIGDFNGNGIPVKNLKIQGNPEDIGVFGYVSYEGSVTGLICDTLEICSTGYSDNNLSKDNQLFSADIDSLFVQNASGFNAASLSLIERGVAGENNLKKLNGTNGTPLTELNNPSNIVEDSTINDKYTFKVYYPTGANKGPFSYSWKSSSPLIKLKEKTNDYEILEIDMATLQTSNDFNSGTNSQIDSRISIIASVDVDGYVFSRVIQSYTVEFYSNKHGYSGWNIVDKSKIRFSEDAASVVPTVGQEGDYYIIKGNNSALSLYYRGPSAWTQITTTETTAFNYGNTAPTWAERTSYAATNGSYYIHTYEDEKTHEIKYVLYSRDALDGYFTANVYCDYAAHEDYPEGDKNTNYHHGNNIGFLAGHVDGSFSNSYVYNGKFTLQYNEGYEAINTESETGLIGEVGTNVVNALDPDFGLTQNGEIGIMNLSRIYSLIRDTDAYGNDITMSPSDPQIKAGKANGQDYISYENYLSPTITRFAKYLRRHPDYENGYITKAGRDTGTTFPGQDWHDYTIPNNYPSDFNSVDFSYNQVVEDEMTGYYIDESTLDLYLKTNYSWGDPLTTDVHFSRLSPDVNTGSVGDYIFNTVTKTLFIKESNSWGDIIPAKKGTDVPTKKDSDKSGDYYIRSIDASTVQLYAFDGSTWNLTTVSSGTGIPNPASGNVGDKYIDLSNGYNDLYIKVASCWKKKAALYGNGEPSGDFGQLGELYVDIDEPSLYSKINNAYEWELDNSATISTQSISPSSELGNNGHYCIDSISYSLFKKAEGEWGILDIASSGRGIVDKSSDNSGDLGLGVFKIVSQYDPNAKVSAASDPFGYFTSGIGKCRIMKGTPKNKVYFSTAELDRTKADSFDAFRATTLPSYYDLHSFDWPFSKDYNYCFELDLSDKDQAQGQYMYNTDSGFLTHYLYNILIDKSGAPIQPGTEKFGFLFAAADDKKYTTISSLSSYMPVGDPAVNNVNTKQNFGTDANPRWYPQNSIVFHIDNQYGANVSVVGNGADITIYGNNPLNNSPITPLYTMKGTAANSRDAHRFFSYDFKTGRTSTESIAYGDMYIKTTDDYEHDPFTLWQESSEGDTWDQVPSVTTGVGIPADANEGGYAYYIDVKANNLYHWEIVESEEEDTYGWAKQYGVLSGSGEPPTNPDMKESNALYGHIFKLPKGDYVIGGENGATANIYYLAVQGQTDSNIGANDTAVIGNAITDVDFLTEPPVADQQLQFAYFSFKCNFNTVGGEYIVGIDTEDENKFRIYFSDHPEPFVIYLLTYSRVTTQPYYIIVKTGAETQISNRYTASSVTYRAVS